MKVIVLIALLALTQAAVSYNFTAYNVGFTDQLGLDASQLQDAGTCYYSTERIFEDIQSAIVAAQKQEGHEVAGALIDLISAVDNTINNDCVAYKEDLLAIFTQNANGTDLKTLVEDNFLEIYPTQVIQQIAFWIQYLIDGDQYNAGKTEAYILQILFGLETPEILPTPEFNYSNYVPIDINTYLPQLYQGLYPILGLTNQTVIDELSTCFTNIYSFIQSSSPFRPNLTDDLGHNIQVVSQLVEKLAETVDTCTSAFEYEWAVGRKMFKIFWESPILDIAKMYFNIAKHLPEVAQKSQTASIDIMTGKYVDAGVLEGEIMNVYFDGIFNLTDIFNSAY